jgi:hypothetical protein
VSFLAILARGIRLGNILAEPKKRWWMTHYRGVEQKSKGPTMSGGSFNYLCFAEPDDIFRKREDLRNMVEALAELGHADAAKETESVILVLNHFEARMRARMDRLHDIWRSVEWVRSGDSAPSVINDAVTAYRLECDGLGQTPGPK